VPEGNNSRALVLSWKLLVNNDPCAKVMVLSTFAVPSVQVFPFLETYPSLLLLAFARGQTIVTSTARSIEVFARTKKCRDMDSPD
jgi:hypothetical protein